VAIAGLLALADSDESGTQLFSALDKNQDGMIDGSEIAKSQQTWFARAIRVADADGNERLDPAELNAALTDPKPRSGVSNKRPRGQRLDARKLDRNNDGRITINEVPAAARERFEKLLNRTGKDSIAVDAMSKLMRPSGSQNRQRQTRQGKHDNKKPNISERSMKRRPGADDNNAMQNRPRQIFQQLDSNSDGKITRREARKSPRFIKRFDRNNDGTVELLELRNPNQSGERGRKRTTPDGRKKSGQDERARPFDRFDKNGDGFISRNETPDRSKGKFNQIDSNGDGKLSRQEMMGAAAGRRSKKPKN
jgi:Ca2+-binding EF-hand superfamily protein